jgi:hypothetical protein
MHAFIGGMGFGEILLVFLIAAFLFGKRLPEVWDSYSSGRRLQGHLRYEAEKRAEELGKRMARFWQAVVFVIGAVSVAVIIVNLLRILGLF